MFIKNKKNAGKLYGHFILIWIPSLVGGWFLYLFFSLLLAVVAIIDVAAAAWLLFTSSSQYCYVLLIFIYHFNHIPRINTDIV